jgi:hypothetical protein
MRLFNSPYGLTRLWANNSAVFEIILFDYALSDAEMFFVRDYFVARYGVTV